jgi:hypothetical protein
MTLADQLRAEDKTDLADGLDLQKKLRSSPAVQSMLATCAHFGATPVQLEDIFSGVVLGYMLAQDHAASRS